MDIGEKIDEKVVNYKGGVITSFLLVRKMASGEVRKSIIAYLKHDKYHKENELRFATTLDGGKLTAVNQAINEAKKLVDYFGWD